MKLQRKSNPYGHKNTAKRNASVLENYPDNSDISPRLENYSTSQKHNTSVGPRIFNVAEYFKSKGKGGAQQDFTEVNSEYKHYTNHS